MPRAVLVPHHADDVPLAVRWAVEAGLPLVPRGAATGMPGGNVGPGVVLDLTRLDDVAEAADGYAERGIVEAGAGAVAAQVDRFARARGRHLPALPSSAAWATIGGMVACDAAGARSFRYGPTHAQVVALEVVRADGIMEWLSAESAVPGSSPWAELRRSLAAEGEADLAAWPRVRKNSSGYALDRFLPSGAPAQLVVGSEGTLAVVTRARLRTLPLPAHTAVCLLGLPNLDALAALAADAEALEASACEYFGASLIALAEDELAQALEGLRAEAGVALVEFQGPREVVEAGLAWAEALGRRGGGCRTGRTPDEVSALWEVRHAASPTIARAARQGRRSLQFMEDSVVPPAAVGVYVSGVETILRAHDTPGVVFGHAGDGNVHVNPLVDLGRPDWRARVRSMLEETVTLVTGLGGTLAGEHGDGRVRAPYLERIWGPAAVRDFRRVKTALDPSGLLNPGVILPLPGQDPLQGLAEGPHRVPGASR